jgi:luciferase family oxidoreductase group 1
MSGAAAKTNKITIECAGLLLQNHPILAAIENFCMLESLYPNKISVGIGQANGLNGWISEHPLYKDAISKHTDRSLLDEKIKNFILCAKNIHQDKISPKIKSFPNIMMLGSGSNGASIAAKHGLPFNIAYFINTKSTTEIINSYRDGFIPNIPNDKPRVSFSIHAICADTDQIAYSHAKAIYLLYESIRQKKPLTLISNGEAAKVRLSEDQKEIFHSFLDKHLIGSKNTILDKYKDIIKPHKPEQIFLNTSIGNLDDRLFSFKGFSSLFNEDIMNL